MCLTAALAALEGTWGFGLPHGRFSVAVPLVAVPVLAVLSVRDLRRKSVTAFLCHAGLLLVVAGGLFATAGRTEASMLVREGESGCIATDRHHAPVPLPFSVTLKSFETEYYGDGSSPKQYMSRLDVGGRDVMCSVNHPVRHGGYRIYQYGFGEDVSVYSVLKIVRDPWLPAVALGAFLLAAGAVLGLAGAWRGAKAVPALVFLAVFFTAMSVGRISFGTLPPALRSPWFAPHLLIYMLAYAALALACAGYVSVMSGGRTDPGLPRSLFATASSLLLLGMLCGAVWAQRVWGDYWAWDAKECWAAVTWLFTLAGLHAGRRRTGTAALFALLSFLAMQMTWYGVNYLPSFTDSLHTYNG